MPVSLSVRVFHMQKEIVMSAVNEWMSLGEAAQALKTTELNVLMHVKRGLLEGREEEDGWTVSAESLMVFWARNDANRKVDLCRSGCGHAGGCGSCG
ncbi:MAG: hypothetical protein D6818_04660 [Bacteroidetes bacterium]|nr:MAG: hypothetical protein D6818_04660 [Bacteroidota bacterium]